MRIGNWELYATDSLQIDEGTLKNKFPLTPAFITRVTLHYWLSTKQATLNFACSMSNIQPTFNQWTRQLSKNRHKNNVFRNKTNFCSSLHPAHIKMTLMRQSHSAFKQNKKIKCLQDFCPNINVCSLCNPSYWMNSWFLIVSSLPWLAVSRGSHLQANNSPWPWGTADRWASDQPLHKTSIAIKTLPRGILISPAASWLMETSGYKLLRF